MLWPRWAYDMGATSSKEQIDGRTDKPRFHAEEHLVEILNIREHTMLPNPISSYPSMNSTLLKVSGLFAEEITNPIKTYNLDELPSPLHSIVQGWTVEDTPDSNLQILATEGSTDFAKIIIDHIWVWRLEQATFEYMARESLALLGCYRILHFHESNAMHLYDIARQGLTFVSKLPQAFAPVPSGMPMAFRYYCQPGTPYFDKSFEEIRDTGYAKHRLASVANNHVAYLTSPITRLHPDPTDTGVCLDQDVRSRCWSLVSHITTFYKVHLNQLVWDKLPPGLEPNSWPTPTELTPCGSVALGVPPKLTPGMWEINASVD